MARVQVKKASASKPAPAPEPVSDDLDIDLSDIDLDVEDALPADLVGDIDIDDLGVADVDDLGVSVEDVEAAMESIQPKQKVEAGVASIGEAALAALSADVAKLSKTIQGLDKTDQFLAAIGAVRDDIARFADAFTAAMERHAQFVADSHKTLLNALTAVKAPPAIQATAPVTTASKVAEAGEDWSKLDTFLKAQLEGLGAGKVYPCDRVAEVFAKRINGYSQSQIQARMAVVYAEQIKKAQKPGHFCK